MAHLKDFGYAQFNLTYFLRDLTGHARETIHLFSKFLADDARSLLFELRDKLDVCTSQLYEQVT
jgi:hypothetical protein